MSETIGFIGLGNMGLPMATNLLAAGYSLKVYNRTPAKAQPLVQQGAQVVDHPAEAVEPGGIVITMLANDAALEEVVLNETGVLANLGKDSVHLSMSTVSPATARKLAALHEQQESDYVAAPVFGRPDAAAARKLWIAVSGKTAAKERVKPILEELGQGLFDFGEVAESANVVKLTGNFLIISAIEAMAEAFTLAEKNGIDRAEIANLFGQTLFACPIYQNYGRMIAQQQYEPAGFKLALGLKDVTLALQTARESQMPLPLASLLHDRLLAMVAEGKSEVDWTGLALKASQEAGLQ